MKYNYSEGIERIKVKFDSSLESSAKSTNISFAFLNYLKNYRTESAVIIKEKFNDLFKGIVLFF